MRSNVVNMIYPPLIMINGQNNTVGPVSSGGGGGGGGG